LIGSASLTAYADMVLSISLDTFYSNKNYAMNQMFIKAVEEYIERNYKPEEANETN